MKKSKVEIYNEIINRYLNLEKCSDIAIDYGLTRTRVEQIVKEKIDYETRIAIKKIKKNIKYKIKKDLYKKMYENNIKYREKIKKNNLERYHKNKNGGGKK